jgi:hypothetical protein
VMLVMLVNPICSPDLMNRLDECWWMFIIHALYIYVYYQIFIYLFMHLFVYTVMTCYKLTNTRLVFEASAFAFQGLEVWMVLFQTKYVQIIYSKLTSGKILTDRARLTATSKLLIGLGGEIVFCCF